MRNKFQDNVPFFSSRNKLKNVGEKGLQYYVVKAEEDNAEFLERFLTYIVIYANIFILLKLF